MDGCHEQLWIGAFCDKAEGIAKSQADSLRRQGRDVCDEALDCGLAQHRGCRRPSKPGVGHWYVACVH